MVFEFLGVPENKPMLVRTQQRITLNNTNYYVDMVFYNKILRAYVLIELKTTKFTPDVAGQLNMYLNYYAAGVNDEHDNPPIGIIFVQVKIVSLLNMLSEVCPTISLLCVMFLIFQIRSS